MSLNESIDHIEQSVFHEKNVWIYRIPPRLSSLVEPRAEFWDPDHPLMTGSMKIIRKGDDCFLQLFEPLSNDTSIDPVLFAQCPVSVENGKIVEGIVQDCADSSRYFVVRAEDEKTKKHAYIGIGFAERSSAFNFKACLQDYERYVQRLLEAQRIKQEQLSKVGENTTSSDGSFIPTTENDYSLQEGQTLHLNINNLGLSTRLSTRSKKSEQSITGILAPPPPPPQSYNPIQEDLTKVEQSQGNPAKETIDAEDKSQGTPAKETNDAEDESLGTTAKETIDAEDDWGDFTSCS